MPELIDLDAYIADGYTQEATRPTDGRLPDVTVTYRPIGASERAVVSAKLSAAYTKRAKAEEGGDEAAVVRCMEKVEAITNELICDRVQEWSLDAPLEPATVGKLPGVLQEWLFDLSFGNEDKARADAKN